MRPGRLKMGKEDPENPRKITSEDGGTKVDNRIAVPEAKAKRGKPKKGTRVPEGRSERALKVRN